MKLEFITTDYTLDIAGW